MGNKNRTIKHSELDRQNEYILIRHLKSKLYSEQYITLSSLIVNDSVIIQHSMDIMHTKYLINGYFRQFNENVPNDVHYICFIFYFIDVPFQFTHTNTEHVEITENGTRIKSVSGYHDIYISICVSSDVGWNNGIHSWSIKSNKSDIQHSIGVTTNYSDAIIKGKRIYDLNGQTICYDGGNGWSGTIHIEHGVVLSHAPCWSTGDIITTTLNCNEWTVTFYKNSDFVGSFNLKHKNKVYYPVIGMMVKTLNDNDYKLL
eukprot:85981_1